jgi:RNA polymerase sigma-70 factor (ECF subfamily)
VKAPPDHCRNRGASAGRSTKSGPSSSNGFSSARVRAGLKALTYVQRQALLLAYFEGYSQRQISTDLSVPLHSVRLQMLDGLVNLRRALEVADD